jgi:membrane protease YdiL (CAAX protease family)
MAPTEDQLPRTIPAVALIHQEGVIGVIALVGLSFRPQGLVDALSPVGSLALALLVGVGAGALSAGLFRCLRSLPPLAALEGWQRRMVKGWSIGDTVAVAVFSGLAEEALVRALLQPIIGLLPAALLFAVLHFTPDRRLWMWPVLALILGVMLGILFEYGGYPAAAAAHVTINAVSLYWLQRSADG